MVFNACLNDLEKEVSSEVANPQMASNCCSCSGRGCEEHFYGKAPAQELGGDPSHSGLAGGTLCILAIGHKAAGLQLPRLSDGSRNKARDSEFWSPPPAGEHIPWGAVRAE